MYPNFTVDINTIKTIFDLNDKNNFTVYKTWLDFLKFLNRGTIFSDQNSKNEKCEFHNEFTAEFSKIFDFQADNHKLTIFKGKPKQVSLEKTIFYLENISKNFTYVYDIKNLNGIHREVRKFCNFNRNSVNFRNKDLISIIVDWIRNIDDNADRIVLMFLLINSLIYYKDDKLGRSLISLMIHIFLYYRCDSENLKSQMSSSIFYIDRLRFLLKSMNITVIYKFSENNIINGKSLKKILNQYYLGKKENEGEIIFFYCLIISNVTQFHNRASVYIDFLVHSKSHLVQRENKRVFEAIIQHLIQILDKMDLLKPQ